MRLVLAGDSVGPLFLPWRLSPEERARRLYLAVDDHLPREWRGRVRQLAVAARGPGAIVRPATCAPFVLPAARMRECEELARWIGKYSGARSADLDEAGIRDRAADIARRAASARLDSPPTDASAGALLSYFDRLHEFAGRYGVLIRYPRGAEVPRLAALGRRLCCARWWRRAVRRWVAQQYERGAIELGFVGAQARQIYCSDRAVKRRIAQRQASEEAMRATVIESDRGDRMTVWDAAQASVSNKAIRRGELMTRIRGCEEWAEAGGMVGLFVTATCPSRYHAQRRQGGANPRYDGSTPAEAQAWLCATWARLRAKWQRDGLRVFGFRIAEPHHDGCPHWHLLLWCEPARRAEVESTFREWWLKDAGDEPGAALYRVTLLKMSAGGASGYVAKYVAKNIDDHGIDEHRHEQGATGRDLWGDCVVTPAMRVEAWAATWRIRQFQAIGQPPVTVWRELRRIDERQAAGGSDAVWQAWQAAHRRGHDRADWAGYMGVQGGAMRARVDHRLCVHYVERERAGRYEVVRFKWASGVVDRAAGRLGVVPSRRRRWGGEGFAAAKPAAPWTRFSNCTRPAAINRPVIDPFLKSIRPLIESGALFCDKPRAPMLKKVAIDPIRGYISS